MPDASTSAPPSAGAAKNGDSKDTNGADKAPNPLDGLSSADLRKKLDTSKKELRGYLEKKKRIDRELVSPSHKLPCLYLSGGLDSDSRRIGNLGGFHLRL
jgi:hypothetical protein